MTPKFNITFFICIAIGFIGKDAAAQIDSNYIDKIRDYVYEIDSINESFNEVKHSNFSKSTSCGVIKQKNKVVGGIGIKTLANTTFDTAFRIEYHDNFKVNIYKTYYFKENDLIYAKVELFEFKRGKRELIYFTEEFYSKGEKVFYTINKTKFHQKYSNKINFLLYQDGIKFLKEFITK